MNVSSRWWGAACLVGSLTLGCGGQRVSGEFEGGEPAASESALAGPGWGTIAWAKRESLPYPYKGVAAGANRIYTIHDTSRGALPGEPYPAYQVKLESFGSDGALAWSSTIDRRNGFDVDANETGDVYLVTADDMYPPGRQYLTRFTDRGLGTDIFTGGDTHYAEAKGAHGEDTLFLHHDYLWTRLEYGSPAKWSFETYYTDLKMLNARMDSRGNVVMLGELPGEYSIGGQHFGVVGASSLLVVKFDATGKYLWGHEFRPAGGQAVSVGFDLSALDTIVVAGHFTGTASWAGGTYDASGGPIFLLTMEPNGAARWFRQTSGMEAMSARFALDKSGSAFLVGSATNCSGGLGIQEINLAGAEVGTKLLGCGSGQLSAVDAATLGHDLVIAGSYTGAVDFQSGTPSNAGEEGGFVLRMQSP